MVRQQSDTASNIFYFVPLVPFVVLLFIGAKKNRRPCGRRPGLQQ